MFANFRERCGLLPGGGALDRCGPAWARGDGPTLQPCSGTVQKTARQTTGAVPRAGHPSPQNTLAYSRNARTVTPPGTRSVPVERARNWPVGFSQERSGSRHPYLPRQIGQALKTAHVSLRCVQRTTSGPSARVPGKSGTGGDATHVKHNALTVNQERESMFRMNTALPIEDRETRLLVEIWGNEQEKRELLHGQTEADRAEIAEFHAECAAVQRQAAIERVVDETCTRDETPIPTAQNLFPVWEAEQPINAAYAALEAA